MQLDLLDSRRSLPLGAVKTGQWSTGEHAVFEELRLQGKTYFEIARLLERTPGSVKEHARYSRNPLQARRRWRQKYLQGTPESKQRVRESRARRRRVSGRPPSTKWEQIQTNNRARSLNESSRDEAINHYTRWSAAEDATLVSMKLRGHLNAAIASLLGRSISSVAGRASRLRKQGRL